MLIEGNHGWERISILPMLLALAHCGGSSAPTTHADTNAAWVSGARLRAIVLDGGDGAAVFMGWHDRELGADCAFDLASDGRTRCLPVAQAFLGYGDPTCSRVVAGVPSGAAPTYVRTFNPSPLPPTSPTCASIPVDAPVAIQKLGAATPVDKWFFKEGDACIDLPLAQESTSGYDFETASPDSFVAATEVEHGEPLGVRELVADDGSRDRRSLVDTRSQSPCLVLADHFVGAPETCVTLPLAAATTEWGESFFSDPRCTVAAAASPAACPTPTVAIAFVPEQCRVEVRSLGSKNKIGIVFKTDAYCNPYSVDAPLDSYSMAPVYMPEDSMHASAVLVGGGRLRARFRTASDGALVALHPDQEQMGASANTALHIGRTSFFDAQLQVTCTVSKLADQTMRCIPVDVQPLVGGMFADPNCSAPIYVTPPTPGCAASAPRFVTRAANAPNSDTISELFELGPVAEGKVYFVTKKPLPGAPVGGCIFDPAAPAVSVYYPVGASVHLDALPLVRSVIE